MSVCLRVCVGFSRFCPATFSESCDPSPAQVVSRPLDHLAPSLMMVSKHTHTYTYTSTCTQPCQSLKSPYKALERLSFFAIKARNGNQRMCLCSSGLPNYPPLENVGQGQMHKPTCGGSGGVQFRLWRQRQGQSKRERETLLTFQWQNRRIFFNWWISMRIIENIHIMSNVRWSGFNGLRYSF